MDWRTLLAAFTGNALIIAIVAYGFKRYYDSLLKSRFVRLDEKYKERIKEGIRREAFLFDDQYKTLKDVIELLYRTRNLTREITIDLQQNENREEQKLLTFLKMEYSNIEEYCFKMKSIIPESIFFEVHKQKNLLREFIHCALMEKNNDDENNQDIGLLFSEIDNGFINIVSLSKDYLNISS